MNGSTFGAISRFSFPLAPVTSSAGPIFFSTNSFRIPRVSPFSSRRTIFGSLACCCFAIRRASHLKTDTPRHPPLLRQVPILFDQPQLPRPQNQRRGTLPIRFLLISECRRP